MYSHQRKRGIGDADITGSISTAGGAGGSDCVVGGTAPNGDTIAYCPPTDFVSQLKGFASQLANVQEQTMPLAFPPQQGTDWGKYIVIGAAIIASASLLRSFLGGRK
jgi:hypothetical protein